MNKAITSECPFVGQSVNKAILSSRHPQPAQRLKKLGYTVIPGETIPCKMPYERDHADLQCLILDDHAFVLNGCERLMQALLDDYQIVICGENFRPEYPYHVCLSAVKLDRYLICRAPSLDRCVREYAEQNGYRIVHVNQGYAKCACAVVSDNAVITEDAGVYRSLKELKEIDVLLIGKGRVRLSGADCGFIGGACGYDKAAKTLYFCGDITLHPDHDAIKRFCEAHGTRMISLTDGELSDIGGIVFC